MSDIRSTVFNASVKILRPLIRILLRNGVACGDFIEQIRKAYVDESFAMVNKKSKATISAVSAHTGLSRKEVKRLCELEDDHDSSTSIKYNRAIRVISGWLNDRRFTSDNSVPLALSMTEEEPSFARLVKDYSGDIPTRAMFDMLQASHCVEQKDGLVYLTNHAYVPGNDSAEIIQILGADTHELIETIDHNLTCAENERRFQRKVSSALVKAGDANEFQAYANQRAQALLEDLDTWISQHEVTTQNEPSKYISLGIYHYENALEVDEEK